MTAFFQVLNGLLSLRVVQYALLAIAVLLLALTTYLEVRVYFLKLDIKSTKADLVWVQGTLDLQNATVKAMGEQQKELEAQKRAKAAEAEHAKATAAGRANEIMRLKMSTDCKEVAQWGIEQGLSQSLW